MVGRGREWSVVLAHQEHQSHNKNDKFFNLYICMNKYIYNIKKQPTPWYLFLPHIAIHTIKLFSFDDHHLPMLYGVDRIEKEKQSNNGSSYSSIHMNLSAVILQ